MSQAELATRLGVARETVARWESGAHEPSFEGLQRAIAACGLQLTTRLDRADASLHALVDDQLALVALQRLRALLDGRAAARCEEVLRAIAGLSVDAVLCGPVGAVLLGGPNRPWTGRVDLCVDEHEAVIAVGELRERGAQPEPIEERWGRLQRREPWTLRRGGELALLREPAGTRGARDLRRDAITVDLDEQAAVLVAHPRDLLRIAYASPDERDQAMAAGYAALLQARQPRRVTRAA